MSSKILCSIAVLLALASAACDNCGPNVTARGAASVTWQITVNGQPATCARVGAASVSLLLHSRTSADSTFAFSCTDTQGTTPLVTAGAYEATLTLRAADGATLAIAPTQATVTIAADQVTRLAPVAFTLGERGKLVVSLGALTTSSNCKPRDQGGAGITGDLITLAHARGGCAAVTFTRSRGNTPLGTYTVNCSSPEVATCIERDETLTVDGIESGPYAISVRGLTGVVRCWESDDVLSVPAGATLVKPIQLAPQPGPGC